jgi:DNA-binding transcriptional MerR regulator
MEQAVYRIGEASAQLGLHDKNSNTLRSWVEEFKEHLSSGANPEPGRPRFFTEDDLRVLRTVRDLRNNHLPYSEIKARLAQGAHAVEQPAPEKPEEVERRAPRETALIPGDQFQALLAPMAKAAEEWRSLAEQYRSRLDDREARVAALEQRIDGLQARLQELYAQSLARHDRLPQPARRRWWLLF